MLTAPLRVLAALIFLLSLTGSQCVFVAFSGDRSSDDDSSGLIVVIREGRFVDAPVEGLHYASGIVAGFTGADGEFRYQSDSSVSFSIGDLVLGQASRGAPVITPLDLVPGGGIDTPAVINIARLLLSLDATPGDASITIPPALHHEAVHSNARLSGVLEFIDFHDNAMFVNAASQLIAVLTRDYPFTAVLVDRETARDHLQNTVDNLP
jgi:hypothetical protein